MGTLTLALTAALLAGSAPDKVSGKTEQKLDLRGRWEGTLQHKGVVQLARLEQGKLRVAQDNAWATLPWQPEGARGGKCWIDSGYGIALSVLYKVDGERVLMCVRDDGQEPVSLLSSGPHWLLILRPKPCK